MSRRSAESNGKGRVAVIGAPTLDGGCVRDALVSAGVPGSRVDLYGSTCGEVVLSEYAGEARMIQEPVLAEIVEHEIVFICEEGEVSRRIASVATPDCLIIDLVDCLPAHARPRRVQLDVDSDIDRPGSGGCFVVPHPLALLIAGLLQPLEREIGVAEAMAVVIRPAADFGEPGIKELREQTIRLLSFAEVPIETFGRQLAFNVIPQTRLAGLEPGVESRIAAETSELLGWNEPRFGVRLLAAPIFHGHGLQMHFRPRVEVSLERVLSVLREAGSLGEGEAAATPLEAEARVSLSDISWDGLGGFWMWAVAGETAALGAEQAVQLAARLRLL
jgi:aspartate-semialdehyde dehydrogenase